MELQKYVNRVKCEKYTEFSESVFKLEYEMAAALTKGIINSNDSFFKQEDAEKYCNENHIPTTISFLGDRGVGKSSVMLSFAYFLKTYNDNNVKNEDKFWLSDNINFYVLPKIDATMLMHGEGLFDVALAKMWDKFYEDVENSTRKKSMQDQVRRKFEDVKRSYNSFCAEKKEKNVSQLTELHALSQSLNLRDDFCKLVEEFAIYMDKESHRDSYIVFAIDDLDMVTGDTYLKLEELRLFMTIPKVIVLLTADLGHLSMNIENIWAKQLKCLGDTEKRKNLEYDREIFREYSVKYLAKILPRNMRIFMPDSKKIADMGLKKAYAEIVKLLFKEDTEKSLSVQKVIYIFIRKQIGLSLYNKRIEELDKGLSLRETVNILAELNELANNQEKEKAELWVRKEVMISSNRIEEQLHRELIKKIHDMNRKAFDLYFSQFYASLQVKKLEEIEGVGYKATIERLVRLCNEMSEWQSLEKLLIWSYALKIKDEEDNTPENLLEELREDFLFDSLIELSSSGLMEPESYIEKCFNDIGSSSNTDETVYRNLSRLFLTLLFFDMETVLKNATIDTAAAINESVSGEKRTSGDFIWNFRKNQNVKASFYCFFSNLLSFKEKREFFIGWVKKTCSNNRMLKGKVKMSKFGEFSKSYLELSRKLDLWKAKHEIESLLDIFPLSDIAVMMNIMNKLIMRKNSEKRIHGLY